MIFSSYSFIFIFLPIVFIGYFSLTKLGLFRASKCYLIVCSLVFYYLGSPEFFPFFMIIIIINYLIGRFLNKLHHRKTRFTHRKIFLILGILINVSLLGYYKYTDFILLNVNFFFHSEIELLHILLPIGISFITFQLIAYLVDSYNGKTENYDSIDYCLFITFFPQLIVGPIVHHKDVVPQYISVEKKTISFDNIAAGLFMFSIGCFKKIILADNLTPLAQADFSNYTLLSMPEAWLASLSYTMSYYFDLSGYADMAIGLGLLFNITLPSNFSSPYKARNFAEYWRRWHMTLSRFLGRYIFRSIFNKGDGSARFYCAIFITFMVSGIWHGAGWQFVVWGIINGVFVIFAHLMARNGKSLPFLLAWALTFTGVIVTRTIFVSPDLSTAISMIQKMFNFSDIFKIHLDETLLTHHRRQIGLLGICSIIVFLFPNSNILRDKFKPNYVTLLGSLILIITSLLFMNKARGFLYFQF